MSADLILTGAVVRTADAVRPVAQALAVRDGRLLAVGSESDVLAHRGAGTRVRDLRGAAVYPGFVDVHNHHAIAGRTELFEMTLPASLTPTEILDRVRSRAVTLPADAWITGGVVASTVLPGLATTRWRRRLDEAAGGRPVMIAEDSRHNRWANTRALELAGITAGSRPGKGVTVLDPDDGTPTGVLIEAAGIPVQQAFERTGGLSPQQHAAASRRGIELLNGVGVTAFQDAAASVEILRALAELDHDGRLHAWVVSSLLINDEIFGFSPLGEELLDHGEEFRSPHHRPDFVKIFLDGVPPMRTAAFLEPYLPDRVHGADFRGATTMTPDELYDWLRRVAQRGLGAKVHCTGDGSARMVLDAVARVRADGFADTRFHIAHGQFLAESDISRMARLHVTADISPFLWYPGVITTALGEVLGPQRAAHLQLNRSLTDAGALVAGGSDWPVSESPNPLEGLQGLITRADPRHRVPGALWPEQALTAPEALAVFTLHGARAMGVDDVTGSLRPGKSADFVILDRDVVAGPPEDIVGGRLQETWFGGAQVYAA